jgi:hypothetical protein
VHSHRSVKQRACLPAGLHFNQQHAQRGHTHSCHRAVFDDNSACDVLFNAAGHITHASIRQHSSCVRSLLLCAWHHTANLAAAAAAAAVAAAAAAGAGVTFGTFRQLCYPARQAAEQRMMHRHKCRCGCNALARLLGASSRVPGFGIARTYAADVLGKVYHRR